MGRTIRTSAVAIGSYLAFLLSETASGLGYSKAERAPDQRCAVLLGYVGFLAYRAKAFLRRPSGQELAKVTWPTRKETSAATVVGMSPCRSPRHPGRFRLVWGTLANLVMRDGRGGHRWR